MVKRRPRCPRCKARLNFFPVAPGAKIGPALVCEAKACDYVLPLPPRTRRTTIVTDPGRA